MDINKATEQFYNIFQFHHAILYVGQNVDEGELKELVAGCPWSAVITSRRDPEFSSYFAEGERRPKNMSLASRFRSSR